MPHRHISRIAGEDIDLLRRPPALVGGNLSRHRFSPLSHWRGTRLDGPPARSPHSNGSELDGSPPGTIHAVSDAEADISPFCSCFFLAHAEFGISGSLQGQILAFWKIAAVVFYRRTRARFQRRRIWHRFGWHEVTPPYLGPVDT